MGLFNKDNSSESAAAKQELKNLKAQMKQEKQAAIEAEKAAMRAAKEKAEAETAAVLITTGDIKANYDIIDCVFAVDSSRATFLSGVNPDTAFNGVKNVLRSRCYQLGGQAVINCQFQYRNALNGSVQVLEIFAYGTAVRLR